MKPETNLDKLIQSMNPVLNDGTFVFATANDLDGIDKELILFSFREKEGLTLILPQKHAQEIALECSSAFAWITLEVHSSLDAVGLTAAFSTELSKHNLSCNVVAGFYHDHIFVPHKQAGKAIKVLKTMSV